jgi:hypothetical protein
MNCDLRTRDAMVPRKCCIKSGALLMGWMKQGVDAERRQLGEMAKLCPIWEGPPQWYQSGMQLKWNFLTRGTDRHRPRLSRAYRHKLRLFCRSVRICAGFVSPGSHAGRGEWRGNPTGREFRSAMPVRSPGRPRDAARRRSVNVLVWGDCQPPSVQRDTGIRSARTVAPKAEAPIRTAMNILLPTTCMPLH